jgi:putative selenate reductase molybdopterin-binding subunit
MERGGRRAVAEVSRVGSSIPKIDSLGLATGQARFTADHALPGALACAILWSPHAHAEILSLDDGPAREVPGVVDVLTFQNTPRVLHTTAGQEAPEPSPYDTVLFDRTMRFVGDRVALVAAESLAAAREAAGRIVVEYRQLDPVFDPEAAMRAVRIHGEEAHPAIPARYDAARNLCAEVELSVGDPGAAFEEAELVDEGVYHTHATSHCAMEPHAASAWLDGKKRLVILSATQVPFHARRIVAALLGLPLQGVRVIKPRVGGGFGGKQEVMLEPLVALVTLRTGRPARLSLTREEVFRSTRTRHAVRIRTAVRRDGSISALEMDALAEAGAYATHSLTVVSNTCAKVLPLFNKVDHLRFLGRAVYTNRSVAGALRGYGAPQGFFALNQQLDMIARNAGVDMAELCSRWHIRVGESSPVFELIGEGAEGVGQTVRSCRLSECIAAGAQAIGWAAARGRAAGIGSAKGTGSTKGTCSAAGRVRGVGMAVAMQGSGIPRSDRAEASMTANSDGTFTLLVGATDIGNGSDTILAQIAAEALNVSVGRISVISSDTDVTPFDSGAYASSTTYVSGTAVRRCAEQLRAALVADSEGSGVPFAAHASFVGDESPPPFIAQFAEVEVDLATGRIYVLRFVSAVDCGRAINPMLVEGQVEGSVAMGIGQALWEGFQYDAQGRMTNAGFWDYRIGTALDMPEIRTIIVESEEPTGPFGAKSVGEVAMNGPAPAIANAVYDAVGVRLLETPFTPEKLWRAMREQGGFE